MTACEDGACYPCWAPDRCHVCGETRPCDQECEAEDGRPLDPAMNPKAKDRRDEDYE